MISGLMSTPCSLPPRKCTSCARMPSLTALYVRFWAGAAAGAKPAAPLRHRPASQPRLRRVFGLGQRAARATISRLTEIQRKSTRRRRRTKALKRHPAKHNYMLLQKFNTRATEHRSAPASRPNQLQRLLGYRDPHRQPRDNLAIGLYRGRAGGRHQRFARTPDGNIAAARQPTEQQRAEVAHHGKPPGALKQHEIEHRLGKLGPWRDHV